MEMPAKKSMLGPSLDMNQRWMQRKVSREIKQPRLTNFRLLHHIQDGTRMKTGGGIERIHSPVPLKNRQRRTLPSSVHSLSHLHSSLMPAESRGVIFFAYNSRSRAKAILHRFQRLIITLFSRDDKMFDCSVKPSTFQLFASKIVPCLGMSTDGSLFPVVTSLFSSFSTPFPL